MKHYSNYFFATLSFLTLFFFFSLSSSIAKEKKACPDITSLNIGKKLSVDLKETQLEKVFKLLAKESSFNIVGINTPKSKVSLILKDKPVKEILDTLSKQQNLHYNMNGNVISFFKNTDPARFKISKYKQYQGKCISLDFQETAISSAIKIIEGVSGKTISNLKPETLNKKVTFRLINLPWQQALDIILIHDGKEAVYSGENISAN